MSKPELRIDELDFELFKLAFEARNRAQEVMDRVFVKLAESKGIDPKAHVIDLPSRSFVEIPPIPETEK